MSFLAPIAGLIAGVAGSGLVVLFWMLKLRRRPVRVSSTMLWKRAIRDMEGNVPWQMARPSVLLFLQLLAVVLLAFAIARPVGDGGVRYGEQVAIVIDAGASMGAVVDDRGTTRLEIAKNQAIALVRQIGSRSSSTKFRVVRAGAEPMLLAGNSGSWRQARAAIESIEGSDVPSDLGAALMLIRDMDSTDETDEESDAGSVFQSFVFSDADLDKIHGEEFSETIVHRPVNEDHNPRENIGIVLVGGQRDQVNPDLSRVFVTVAGVVDGTTGVVLKAKVDGEVVVSKAIELSPDEHGVAESATTLVFPLRTAAMVEVSIERDDSLRCDNRAWVWMPDPAPIVTTIVAPDGQADPLLVDVLSAVTGGAVAVVGPDDSVAGGTGLMVFDRVINARPIRLPSIVIGGAGVGGGVDEDSSLRRVLTWDRDHPVMRDVDLSGLRYVSGAGLEGSAIAQGRAGGVIVEAATAGVRQIKIGFAIEDSNWGVQVSMPMFFANAVGYLLPGSSGAGVVRKINEPIELLAVREEIHIEDAEGSSWIIHASTGSMNQIRGIDRVGVRAVTGSDVDQIGISLLNRNQTMQAGRLPVDDDQLANGLASTEMMSQGRVEIWRWFVLAALGVLTIEWTLDLMRRRI